MQDALGRGDGDDEVGLDERGGDADAGCPASVAELDELLALGVVDDQPPAEAPAELGRRRAARSRAARAGGRARSRRGSSRARRRARSSSSTVAAIASWRGSGERRGERQVRQLDHDRRRAARRDELGERRAGEREAERLAGRGGDAVERELVAGRRRTQHDPVRRARRRPRPASPPAAERGSRASARAGVASIVVSPKTLSGEELALDDAPARDCRALPRRRQQPRLPRLLRAARGARDLRRPARRRAARLHEHALQAARRLPPARRSRSPGTRGRCTAPRSPRAADVVYKEGRRPMPDLLRRAVPALPADRRGVRLREPRVRGLGGRRRDRDARDARRRRRARAPASSRPTATPSSSAPRTSA